MNHDPLCNLSAGCTCPPESWMTSENLHAADCSMWLRCDCGFIDKVRTDERSRCIAEVEALGPLQQLKRRKGEDGYLIEGYEIVDVAEALRSRP